MVLFLSAGKGYVALQVHQKCALRIAQRSRGAKLGSQLRDCVRLVQTESLSLNCLTTVLLQVLQCLALPIYFAQSLY